MLSTSRSIEEKSPDISGAYHSRRSPIEQITSPLSSLRIGEDQRRTFIEAKLDMDGMLWRLSSNENDHEFLEESKEDSGYTSQAQGRTEKKEDIRKSEIQNQIFEVNVDVINTLHSTQEKKINNDDNLSEQRKQNIVPLRSLINQRHASASTQFLSNLPYWKQQKNLEVAKLNNFTSSKNQEEIDYIEQESNQSKSIATSNKDLEKRNDEGFKGVWKKKSLIVIWLVKKFITDLLRVSESWRYSKLTGFQLQGIQDISCNQKVFLQNRQELLSKRNQLKKGILVLFMKKVILFFKNLVFLLTNSLVIHPDSTFKLLWDCAILFILFINIFFIPIKQCFTDKHAPDLNQLLQILLSDLPGWAFLSDIVVCLNTGIYQKGQLVTQKSKIISLYYKQNLIIDLITIISFLISLRADIPYLNIILLLRTNRLLRLSNSIEQKLNLSLKKSAMFNLTKLAVIMIFIAHFCGCIFFYVGTQQKSVEDISEQSWIDKAGIEDSTFQVKYTSCLYWAIITMITIGYGDITPLRLIEKQSVLFMAIISCGVYAYSINIVGIILQDLTKEKQDFKKKMSVLSSYMRKRNIKSDSQQQIKKYFTYMYEQNLKFNEGETIFFSELKGQLKTDVLQDTYYKVLHSTKLFRMNFSQNLLHSLANVMEEKRYVCDEIILDFQQDSDTLFFMLRGEVQSLMKGGQVVGVHEKGSMFDEMEFFRSGISDLQYKSSGISTIVHIKKHNMERILRNFPKDYEKYCLMKDTLRMEGSLKGFGRRCQFCNSFQHIMKRCEFLHWIVNKRKILYKHNKVILQDRNQNFIRREKSKANSFNEFNDNNLEEIRDQVIQYLIDYNPLDESPQELLMTVQKIVEYDIKSTQFYKIETIDSQKISLKVKWSRQSLANIQSGIDEEIEGVISKRESHFIDDSLDHVTQQHESSKKSEKTDGNHVFPEGGGGAQHFQQRLSDIEKKKMIENNFIFSEIHQLRQTNNPQHQINNNPQNISRSGLGSCANNKFKETKRLSTRNSFGNGIKQLEQLLQTNTSSQMVHLGSNSKACQTLEQMNSVINTNDLQQQQQNSVNQKIKEQRDNVESWKDEFERFFLYTIYFPEYNLDKVLKQQLIRRKTLQSTIEKKKMKEQEIKLKSFKITLNQYKNGNSQHLRIKNKHLSIMQRKSENSNYSIDVLPSQIPPPNAS